jgi:transcriptional regulator with XRE-family HTH domain
MSNADVTSAQVRGARGLLGWSQASLASSAGLALQTIMRFETGRGARVSGDAAAKIVAALESAGVIFVEENGEGPGVRLRKAKLE